MGMDMERALGGCGYFCEKFLGGMGDGVRYQNACAIHTVLSLSLQYKIMAYLCIGHNIAGFPKLTDLGGNGKFSTKKIRL